MSRRDGGWPVGPAARAAAAHALADARPACLWLDDPAAPAPGPALESDDETDLAIVGGGYTGLWTALLAKQRDPSRDVVLLEGRTVGWAASGRNGGFCEASLTHGLANGLRHFGEEEMATLQRLGADNLDAIGRTVAEESIACDWTRPGSLSVAVADWQVDALHEDAALAARFGDAPELLDRDAVRAEVDSPSYLAGSWDRTGTALVHPAKLAWGLAAAARRAGVRLHERTPVSGLGRDGAAVAVRTPRGTVRARRVVLGTNAFPSLLRRLRLHTVPVYDHVLATEPLGADRLAALGWRHRQGVADAGNLFHYYRLTADDRLVWGGYRPVYHFGRRVRQRHDRHPATTRLLAEHLFATFPQLDGVRVTHTWGGAIDTCTRFSVFFASAYDGRVVSAAGYTGLGVGTTRFAAETLLDLADGLDTERTRLRMVRHLPVPFPPEPLAWAGIGVTRAALASADARGGRRNLWLRTLDRFGVGLDF